MRNSPVSSRRHPSKAFAGGDEGNRAGSPTAAAGSAGLSGSPRGDGAGGGSSLRRPLVLEPTSPQGTRATDWLSAAVSGGGIEAGTLTATTNSDKGGKNSSRSGGGPDNAGGGGRDAKLNSLLVLSPGKEYWAGRLAEKGSRDSESPRTSARNRERSKNNNNTAVGGVADRAAATSPRETSDLVSPARRGQNKPLKPVERQQQRQIHDGESSGAFSAGASAGKKNNFLSVTGGKTATPLPPSSTSPNGTGLGGGERPNPAPWRDLQSGEIWTPPSRQVASPTIVSWSPVKGQRRPDFRPSSRPVVREENTTVAAALPSATVTRGCGGSAALRSTPAGGDSSFDKTSSPMKSPRGTGVQGGSRSASPKEIQSPAGATVRGGSRSASPKEKNIPVGATIGGRSRSASPKEKNSPSGVITGGGSASASPEEKESPVGAIVGGESRGASPKEKKSRLGAILGGGGRSVSPQHKQV